MKEIVEKIEILLRALWNAPAWCILLLIGVIVIGFIAKDLND